MWRSGGDLPQRHRQHDRQGRRGIRGVPDMNSPHDVLRSSASLPHEQRRRDPDTHESPTMIQRVAVANRGEIASRVFATCRRLGIESLGACTPTPTPTFRTSSEADVATRLPGSTPAETYLRRRAGWISVDPCVWGGQSVHPGYGFLSENADFARAWSRPPASFWLGPPPDADRGDGLEDPRQGPHARRRRARPGGARPAHRVRPPPARQGECGRRRARHAGRTPPRGPRRGGRQRPRRGRVGVRRRDGLRRAVRRVRSPRRGADPVRHPRHRHRRR